MKEYSVYKNNVIEALQNLASYDFQAIAWFDNELGLVSSYSDCVEAVFEDTAVQTPLMKGEIIFNQMSNTLLRELSEMCDAIGYDRDERELINSPDMVAVRQKAAEALALIKASDDSESTIEIIE